MGHSEITSSDPPSSLSRKVNKPPSSISSAQRRSDSCSVPVSGSSKRGIQVPCSVGLERSHRQRLQERPQLTRAGKGWCDTLRLHGQRICIEHAKVQRKERREGGAACLVARTRPFEERACLRQLDELVEVSAYRTIDCRSR